MLLRYDFLVEQVKERQPKTILEVGTWNALNAQRMIQAALDFNQDVFYYGFDLWEGMTEEMVKAEMSKRIVKIDNAEAVLAPYNRRLIAGNTRETLRRFVPDRQIDFVFIDGGHSLETIASDWDNIKRLMDEKTVVILDDYYHNRDDFGCQQLYNQLDRTLWNVELVGPIDVIAVNGLQIQLVKVTKNV